MEGLDAGRIHDFVQRFADQDADVMRIRGPRRVDVRDHAVSSKAVAEKSPHRRVTLANHSGLVYRQGKTEC